MLGKHMWADMNAPLTTTTYSTQDSGELVALPATSKLTNRGKGSGDRERETIYQLCTVTGQAGVLVLGDPLCQYCWAHTSVVSMQ